MVYNLLTGELSEERGLAATLYVPAGWRWKIGVDAEGDDVDFNLYISDSSGNLVAQDESSDPDAYCTIDAIGEDGTYVKYTILAESVKGSGAYTLNANPLARITSDTSSSDTTSDTSSSDTSSDTTSSSDGSELSNGDIIKSGLTDAEKQALLSRHNEWRARYGVAPLEWSDELTIESQAWADELARNGYQLAHSPRPPRTSGENIAWAFTTNFASRDGDLTPAQVVDNWGDEVADYTYATNTCADGKVCGHYTQVVWANTTKVGGGMVKGVVEANGVKSIQEVWVCNYDPAGNYIGQQPY